MNGSEFERRIPLGVLIGRQTSVDLLVKLNAVNLNISAKFVMNDSYDEYYGDIKEINIPSSPFTEEELSEIDQMSYEWYDSTSQYATTKQLDYLRSKNLLHYEEDSNTQEDALVEACLYYDDGYAYNTHRRQNDVTRGALEFFFNLPGSGDDFESVIGCFDLIHNGISDDELDNLLVGF